MRSSMPPSYTGTLDSIVILAFCDGAGQARRSDKQWARSGPDAARSSRRRGSGADVVPRTRLRGYDDRCDQPTLGRAGADGVPALFVQTRDPEGLARYL